MVKKKINRWNELSKDRSYSLKDHNGDDIISVFIIDPLPEKKLNKTTRKYETIKRPAKWICREGLTGMSIRYAFDNKHDAIKKGEEILKTFLDYNRGLLNFYDYEVCPF